MKIPHPLPFFVKIDYTDSYAKLIAENQLIDFLLPRGSTQLGGYVVPVRGSIVARFKHRQDAYDWAQMKSSYCLVYSVDVSYEEDAP